MKKSNEESKLEQQDNFLSLSADKKILFFTLKPE